MKKIPPIIWGIGSITILFVAVVILISGIDWLKQSYSRPAAPTPTVAVLPLASTVTPGPTATLIETPWVNQKTVLFFPVLPLNIYQYSLIQIKNIGTENVADTKVTLLNRQGESQTYPVNNLEPGMINRFSLKNLAAAPLNFSPGIAIVSSSGSLVAVAEVFPTNSDEKSPAESLTPTADLPSDLSFKIYPTAGNEPAQNRLALTNPESKLIEAQVTLTTPEQGSQIIFTKEIPALTTEIVELPIKPFKSYDQFATLLASSSNSIIGAVYHLDNDGGLMSNIRGE